MNRKTLLCADLDTAMDLRAQGKPLPSRLWAAWIGQFCTTPVDTGGYTLDTASDGRLLSYQRPRVLATQGGPWFREVGAELMQQAILLLAEDGDRECALRSAGFLAESEVEEGLVDIATVNRRLEAMGIKNIGAEVWQPVRRQAAPTPRDPRLVRIEEEMQERIVPDVNAFMGSVA